VAVQARRLSVAVHNLGLHAVDLCLCFGAPRQLHRQLLQRLVLVLPLPEDLALLHAAAHDLDLCAHHLRSLR